MKLKTYEIMFERSMETRVIECERITWLTGWVTFTTEGFLIAANPARVIYQVFQVEP